MQPLLKLIQVDSSGVRSHKSPIPVEVPTENLPAGVDCANVKKLQEELLA